VRSAGETETITEATTNDDGRVDDPLLGPDEMETGTFQLLFEVGAYYREGPSGSTFLETVPVRFVIDDADEHYHVPLLLSPGGYTTYRGS
jgi:5-hydroxyisourate hydrolase